jgi:hypothetical protein
VNRISCAATAITFALSLAVSAQNPKTESPVFSRAAVYAYMGKSVPSPDKQKAVRIRVTRNDEDEHFPATVVVTNGKSKFTGKIDLALNAEVLWSPDSKAFAVSGSKDGAGGLYLTDVFTVDETGLTKIPLSDVIWRAFGHPVRCQWPEDPNVGAVAWLESSTHLLLAGQLIGHSVCDSSFTFKAYEVEIPTRKILRTYDQLEAKRLFRQSLGEWLVAAPDGCIKNPKSCWVSANHPESKSQ